MPFSCLKFDKGKVSGVFMKSLTPAFAVGLKRSGKPVRQHALVKFCLNLRQSNHNIFALLPLALEQRQ
jgi:hypothetical protein